MAFKNCRKVYGGCGKAFHTPHRRAKLCPECKERKREERIKEHQRIKEIKEKGDKKLKQYYTCSICGKIFHNKTIMNHISKAHPEEYIKLKHDSFSKIENLEEIK